jgi:hypothetical protein
MFAPSPVTFILSASPAASAPFTPDKSLSEKIKARDRVQHCRLKKRVSAKHPHEQLFIKGTHPFVAIIPSPKQRSNQKQARYRARVKARKKKEANTLKRVQKVAKVAKLLGFHIDPEPVVASPADDSAWWDCSKCSFRNEHYILPPHCRMCSYSGGGVLLPRQSAMAATCTVAAQLQALNDVEVDRWQMASRSPFKKGKNGRVLCTINRRYKWEGDDIVDDNPDDLTEHGLTKRANSEWWDSLSLNPPVSSTKGGRYIVNFLPIGLEDDTVRPGILQRSHVAGNIDSIIEFIDRVLVIERFGNPQITVGFKYHIVQHGSLLLEAVPNLEQHLMKAGIGVTKLLALYDHLYDPSDSNRAVVVNTPDVRSLSSGKPLLSELMAVLGNAVTLAPHIIELMTKGYVTKRLTTTLDICFSAQQGPRWHRDYPFGRSEPGIVAIVDSLSEGYRKWILGVALFLLGEVTLSLFPNRVHRLQGTFRQKYSDQLVDRLLSGTTPTSGPIRNQGSSLECITHFMGDVIGLHYDAANCPKLNHIVVAATTTDFTGLLASPKLEKLVALGISPAKVPHGIIATYRASCGQKTSQEVSKNRAEGNDFQLIVDILARCEGAVLNCTEPLTQHNLLDTDLLPIKAFQDYIMDSLVFVKSKDYDGRMVRRYEAITKGFYFSSFVDRMYSGVSVFTRGFQVDYIPTFVRSHFGRRLCQWTAAILRNLNRFDP